MLPAAVANVLRSTATNAALLITLQQPVRSPLTRCHRRKKQNPRPTRPVGSVVLAKFADSLAPLASPRRAPGANRGLSPFCIRSRPSSRGSLGVRTVKANPPPSRRKSTTRQQQPWSAAGRCRARRLRGVNQNHSLTRSSGTRARWSGIAANSAASSTSSARQAHPPPSRRKSEATGHRWSVSRPEVSPALPSKKEAVPRRSSFRPPEKRWQAKCRSRGSNPSHPRCAGSAPAGAPPNRSAPPSRPPAKSCGFPEGQKRLHPEPASCAGTSSSQSAAGARKKNARRPLPVAARRLRPREQIQPAEQFLWK